MSFERGDALREAVVQPMTAPVGALPKLKILGPVVGADAVFVMDRLGGQERAAKNALHHDAMLLPKFVGAGTPNDSVAVMMEMPLGICPPVCVGAGIRAADRFHR